MTEPQPTVAVPVEAPRLSEAALERQTAGDATGALALYLEVLKLAPTNPGVYCRIALLLREARKVDAAVACFRRAACYAVLHHAESSALYCDLGNLLWTTMDYDAALAAFHRSLELEPDRPETLHSYGVLRFWLGNYGEALAAIDRALQREPENRLLMLNRALTRLASGDLERGFREYDARLDVDPEKQLRPVKSIPLPLWNGESVAGRRLWVHFEQGLGDTLQFARYIPLLAQAGAHVIFDCQTELLRLMPSLGGIAELRGPFEPVPQADFHIPLMSVPARLGTTLETIPRTERYLAPPIGGPALRRPPGTRAAVGILWAGRPGHANDHNRSARLVDFLALADLPGVQLYSLQKGPAAADLRAIGAEALVHDLSPAINDFADTASFLMQLDLLVSVDTAPVHLAGALGRPCFAVLPHGPDWRWMGGREDSPWYPSLRLFRQPAPGDWKSVFARIRQTLATALGYPGGRGSSSAGPAVSLRFASVAEPPATVAVPEEALRLCEVALERQSSDARGALALYLEALKLAPTNVGIYCRIAVLLREARKIDAAVACFRRAACYAALQQAESGALYSDLGNLLWTMTDYDAAMAAFRRALELEPDRPETLHRYGVLRSWMGDYAEALAAYDRALQRQPKNHLLMMNHALARLGSGDLKQGFREVDARFDADLDEKLRIVKSIPLPLWNGESVAGRRLWVYFEQGVGDTLQFARYIPLLAQAGAHVIFDCQSELHRVMASLDGIAELRGPSDILPQADFHIPLLSVPARFGTTLETIPRAQSYLAPPAGGPAIRRPPGTRAAIGIVWAGRPEHPYDRIRSARLEDFLALADLPGVQLYSLQKGSRAADLGAVGAEALIHDLSPAINDFADTASFLMQLDLLVSVDTAPVHLAGALGRPCFALIPYTPDWRWMGGREDSPWYPSLRLFRQPAPGDWKSVFARVRETIATALDDASLPIA